MQTAPTQVAQLAAQPTAIQARKAMSRSAAARAAQGARSGQQMTGQIFVRSAASTQAAQGALASNGTRATTRAAPSDLSRAAQAPIALQRKWDPARSLNASPDQDVQDPEDVDIQEL
ncbi:hypothetical protein AUC69_10455 [Methyloceanibacter superfactus]|uniref:Uncharacterized protein n=1 Tax=Methyloceanibacter superfactus TaxID=1774969 RepID=A0A1E3VXM4_9HYPH|nr:hypothetical protein [Methyloceanibacter superfactus]ODR98294.1 hypothetical protein AUC69_10455 [Methyloceanibacter superfactus]